MAHQRAFPCSIEFFAPFRQRMIRRFAAVAIAAAVASACPSALGQVDAADAYKQAKDAFAKNDFSSARDLLIKASQTDPKNPEVFLLLGKSEYQLGHVEQAINAWNTTVTLSPNEPYSAQMLKALRGDITDIDASLALCTSLLKQSRAEPALVIIDRLLKEKSLSETQRPKAMLIKAECLLKTNKDAQAEALVEEMLLKYPKSPDVARANWILGSVRLERTDQVAQGLALLKKVATENPDTDFGAAAQLSLITFALTDSQTLANSAELSKWIAAHPNHTDSEKARQALLTFALNISRMQGLPDPSATLNDADKAAIAAVIDIYKHAPTATETAAATKTLMNHLSSHYSSNRSYGAAIEGAQSLLKGNPAGKSRMLILQSLAAYQIELALRDLAISAEAGDVPAAMPKPISDALATLNMATKEFPFEALWPKQAYFAERLRDIGSRTPWPTKLTENKPIYNWAAQIALPVIKPNSDAVSMESSIKTVVAIINELGALNKPTGNQLGLKLNAQLLAAVPADNGNWLAVANAQVAFLDKAASFEFAENNRIGKRELNSKLSESQVQFIAALNTIVARQSRQAPAVIQRLNQHLQLWTAHHEYDVVQAAYDKLLTAAPEAQKTQLRLAIVQVQVNKAMVEHKRLATSAAAEPRLLDPTLAKALQSLYILQADLENGDPTLAQARNLIRQIVEHYNQLEYFDVAELAMQEKDKAKPNAQGDTFIQYQLAFASDQSARREIDAFLKQYKATEKLTLTPAVSKAIANFEKFITEHPTDPLARQSTASIVRLGELFEGYTAFDIATKIHLDFAAFAAKNPTLSQSPNGGSSVAERAAFSAVSVADIKARSLMAKAIAKSAQENKGVAIPPVAISPEFAAAISAYKDFIKGAPQSPLVDQALLRINSIALDYARADAWDVADGIYAGILKDKLATRDPQRIEFCQGLCQIGKVMPEHAKEVLATLVAPTVTHGGWGSEGYVKGISENEDKPTSQPREIDGIETAAKEKRFNGGFGGGGVDRAGDQLSTNGFVNGPSKNDAAEFGAPAPTMPTGKPTDSSSFAGATSVSGGLLGTNAPMPTAAADERSKAEANTLAAITRQEQMRANQVASIRDRAVSFNKSSADKKQLAASISPEPAQQSQSSPPRLSDEEIKRQETALDAAYAIFQKIRIAYPNTPTAAQARGEIMVELNYWRTLAQWQQSAVFAERFLKDNPTDVQIPQMRLGIAADHLSHASEPLDPRTTNQEKLAQVTSRFNSARAEFAQIAKDFPEERSLIEDAQWRLATSFLHQAQTVDAFSATLARGQYVRAATELRRIAGDYAQHPQIANIPNMLWEISLQLHNRNYHDESLSVWNILSLDYPTHPVAQQAMLMTAQTYQASLGRPLRAAEVYLEINYAHGGNDANTQNAVFSIGADLKNQKRWIEALQVLENFVQAFPKNPQAGQALAMIGQIHQANDAWKEAIAAYKRVISEFPASGQWAQESKWSIAECTINLSQWSEAVGAYESYVGSYPQDGKVAEAKRRVSILKDLANYQKLVDEKGPKAYDAQFQVAVIVNSQLANWKKAVEEYQKVATNWPKSHLAADALHSQGMLYLNNHEVESARQALRNAANNYPDSPFASDSLFQIGKSYEDEANSLNTVTREATLEINKELSQKMAYSANLKSQSFTRGNNTGKIAELRKAGQKDEADLQIANGSANFAQFNDANTMLNADNASRQQESLTASQFADRQDKINASLRKAVLVYAESSKVPAGDKAGEALLHMAEIQSNRLNDTGQAMATWQEIVRQFSGTAVAEEASWQIAQHHERAGDYDKAIEAYKSFLRNYRRSPKAAESQFLIAENYEHLGQWISAMDQYTNYVQNFPEGVLVQKAKEQIAFIKTYRL